MAISKSTAQDKAREEVSIIKRYSPELLANRPNLYKRCLDGVAAFEALRPRVTPNIDPQTYYTLAGQQFASMLTTASLDNVLTVLIDETTDHKWACHVVTDIPGLIFGSPVSLPYATRPEAEGAVIVALGGLGIEQRPAEGYEPILEPETKRQIRVKGKPYIVSVEPEETIADLTTDLMRTSSLTEDALLATVASMLLREEILSGADSRFVSNALTLLANCGGAVRGVVGIQGGVVFGC